MKNREDTEIVVVFKSCYNELNIKGHHSTQHVLDNECSCAVKDYITSESTDLQFVELYNHRVNEAKLDCKAAKYHTIATLRTIDPTCPTQLWIQFMPQTKATLNIMQISRIDTNKLAYEALNGRRFDWN